MILVDMKKLEHSKLSYKRNELAPSISEDTINYHWGKLYKGYVDRYNAGEGDPDFNEAGAFLHNILFAQFQNPSGSNKPTGSAAEFINKHFTSYDKFQDEFETEAMKIQGSGWAYLSKSGKIKTIKNHEIKNDIVLLIDWWEHAWALDYQHDKKKYLANQWKIINWNIISDRLSKEKNISENTDLDRLKKLAGIGKSISENDSPLTHGGTEKGEYMRKHNIRPGTEEWFRLWFARPGLTGEQPRSKK